MPRKIAVKFDEIEPGLVFFLAGRHKLSQKLLLRPSTDITYVITDILAYSQNVKNCVANILNVSNNDALEITSQINENESVPIDIRNKNGYAYYNNDHIYKYPNTYTYVPDIPLVEASMEIPIGRFQSTGLIEARPVSRSRPRSSSRTRSRTRSRSRGGNKIKRRKK